MLQLAAYALVGVLNSTVDFVVYYGLTRAFGIAVLIANAISFMAGAVNSYIINGRFTFRANSVKLASTARMLRFALVTSVTLGCSTLVMAALISVVPDLYAKAATLVSNLVIGFLLNRALVYRKDA